MSKLPLVSVVLLSYNQSDYLEDAILSVIDQAYREWELIIIDNGSTDGSKSIIKKYLDHKRIRAFMHSANMGVCKRINEGIAAASGDFISILYSDDYYLPEKLNTQINVIKMLPLDWGVVYAPGYRLDIDTKKLEIVKSIESSGDVLKILFTDFSCGFINPISPLIRKECFLKYPFDEEVFLEGEAIFFRIAMKYKFAYIDEPLVVMRDTGNNARYAGRQNSEMFEILLNKIGSHIDFPISAFSCYRRFKGVLFRNNAWQDIRLGSDSQWVRRMVRESIHSDWRQIIHPKIAISFALSFLPVGIRKEINFSINRILNKPNIKYFDKYYPEIIINNDKN